MPRSSLLHLDARSAQAFTLRSAGSTWQVIADQLQFTTWQQARHAACAYARHNGQIEPGTGTRVGRDSGTNTSVTRFGVEIEFRRTGYLSEQEIVEALAAEGVVCVVPGYTHTVMETWKLVPDGSTDLELVSPPMSGADGIRQISAATRVLRRLGCRVGTSEGLHVHVEVAPLTAAQRQTIAALYIDRQRAIDTLVPRSRRNGYYCQPLTAEDRRFALAVMGDDARADYHGSRYRTVNVCSFQRYGTLEFRQHHGTLDGAKIAEWVRFLLSLVTLATSDVDSTNAPTDLDGFTQFLTDHSMLSESDRTRLLARSVRYTR